MGFGQKLTYKTGKEDEENPGPMYKAEYHNSIEKTANKTSSRKNSTFGSDYEQLSKIMYPGMERHYIGTQSPGPGVYNAQDNVMTLSSVKNKQKFSIPRVSRVSNFICQENSLCWIKCSYTIV